MNHDLIIYTFYVEIFWECIKEYQVYLFKLEIGSL